MTRAKVRNLDSSPRFVSCWVRQQHLRTENFASFRLFREELEKTEKDGWLEKNRLVQILLFVKFVLFSLRRHENINIRSEQMKSINHHLMAK